jgi:hypothetical protein
MMNCKETFQWDGKRQTEDKGGITYVFHVHLDRWVHQRPCILDDTHPPTGAQDCHGGTVEIGSDVLRKEIEEGDEGEAISSRRRIAALI